MIISRQAIPALDGADGLVILTPPVDVSAKALAAAIRPGRRTLVVLPKWLTAPDPEHPGWVQRRLLLPPQVIRAQLSGGVTERVQIASGSAPLRLVNVAPLFQADDDLQVGPVERLQTLQPGAGDVQLSDAAGHPVLLRLSRDLYVLSDPDLLYSHGVASLQTARTGVTILDEQTDPRS